MFAAMLFAISIVALAQFALHYWRAVVAGRRANSLPALATPRCRSSAAYRPIWSKLPRFAPAKSSAFLPPRNATTPIR